MFSVDCIYTPRLICFLPRPDSKIVSWYMKLFYAHAKCPPNLFSLLVWVVSRPTLASTLHGRTLGTTARQKFPRQFL